MSKDSSIDRRTEERKRDYEALEKKYKAAEENLKNNPEKCGGEDYIKGYMSGLIDGMVRLAPPHSIVMGKNKNGKGSVRSE